MEPVNQSDAVSKHDTRTGTVIAIGILIASILAIGIYSRWVIQNQKPTEKIEPVSKQINAGTDNLPDTVPSSFEAEDVDGNIKDDVATAPFVLPQLDQSDDLIRQTAPAVSEHIGFPSWLVPDGLVRKFVLMADNVSRGDFPRKQFKHFGPKGKFIVKKSADSAYVIDDRSFRRYDLFAEILASMDMSASAAVYSKFKPLFQEAYEELGYPDQDFNQTLLAAADRILNAPIIERRIALYRPSVMYKFTDRRLEKLNPVYKQLIRMGPKNTKIIQAKVREFADLLRKQGSQASVNTEQ